MGPQGQVEDVVTRICYNIGGGGPETYCETSDEFSNVPDWMDFFFPEPVSIFGFDFLWQNKFEPEQVYIFAVSGELIGWENVGRYTDPEDLDNPEWMFFGYRSSQPIGRIAYDVANCCNPDFLPEFRDLAFSTTVTPEASTWALLGTGMLGLGAIEWRRRRRRLGGDTR